MNSMHAIFAVLLAASSGQAIAAPIDEALFNALKVKEINKTPEGMYGSSEIEKKAGSLVCTKTQTVHPKAVPSYMCQLVGGSDNDLYDALNIPEKDITPEGLVGSRLTEKTIKGGFSCTRTAAVVPKPTPNTTCGFIYKSAPAPADQGAK